MLTLTSAYTSEGASPGSGRGGVGGSGGAPIRYEFTSRGWVALSPWNSSTYTYSILQIGLGSNPISKLEVVSGLNAINLGTNTYHYNSNNCTTKYNPKIYLGTSQTIAAGWNYDSQNTSKPPANQWPQNFGQTSQKGEAEAL